MKIKAIALYEIRSAVIYFFLLLLTYWVHYKKQKIKIWKFLILKRTRFGQLSFWIVLLENHFILTVVALAKIDNQLIFFSGVRIVMLLIKLLVNLNLPIFTSFAFAKIRTYQIHFITATVFTLTILWASATLCVYFVPLIVNQLVVKRFLINFLCFLNNKVNCFGVINCVNAASTRANGITPFVKFKARAVKS